MFVKKLACAAAAVLGVIAAPASAASFIGDNVVIKRVQGGNFVFQTVSTTVGAGAEYTDNFFDIDITENEVIFDGGNFSIGDIFYQIDGLDFDGDPGTANVVQAFSSTQIFGSQANPFGAGRVTLGANSMFKLSFANTTGGAGALARVTFGPGTLAAVPEPASWAMMIGGFGIVGGAMRSARRQASLKLASA
jgi:PEP-CTERM motif